jgi:hypothetical protein
MARSGRAVRPERAASNTTSGESGPPYWATARQSRLTLVLSRSRVWWAPLRAQPSHFARAALREGAARAKVRRTRWAFPALRCPRMTTTTSGCASLTPGCCIAEGRTARRHAVAGHLTSAFSRASRAGQSFDADSAPGGSASSTWTAALEVAGEKALGLVPSTAAAVARIGAWVSTAAITAAVCGSATGLNLRTRDAIKRLSISATVKGMSTYRPT